MGLRLSLHSSGVIQLVHLSLYTRRWKGLIILMNTIKSLAYLLALASGALEQAKTQIGRYSFQEFTTSCKKSSASSRRHLSVRTGL